MEYKSNSELVQQTLDRGDLIVDRTISLKYQPDRNRIKGLTI